MTQDRGRPATGPGLPAVHKPKPRRRNRQLPAPRSPDPPVPNRQVRKASDDSTESLRCSAIIRAVTSAIKDLSFSAGWRQRAWSRRSVLILSSGSSHRMRHITGGGYRRFVYGLHHAKNPETWAWRQCLPHVSIHAAGAGPCYPVCRAPPVLPGSSLVRQDGDEQVGVVPASGNMFAARRQIWLGKPLAGQQVALRIDRTSLHVFHAGELVFRRSRRDDRGSGSGGPRRKHDCNINVQRPRR
jgi:hypothetical protein